MAQRVAASKMGGGHLAPLALRRPCHTRPHPVRRALPPDIGHPAGRRAGQRTRLMQEVRGEALTGLVKRKSPDRPRSMPEDGIPNAQRSNVHRLQGGITRSVSRDSPDQQSPPHTIRQTMSARLGVYKVNAAPLMSCDCVAGWPPDPDCPPGPAHSRCGGRHRPTAGTWPWSPGLAKACQSLIPGAHCQSLSTSQPASQGPAQSRRDEPSPAGLQPSRRRQAEHGNPMESRARCCTGALVPGKAGHG